MSEEKIVLGEVGQKQKIRRIYAEKKRGYDVGAEGVCEDIKNNLKINSVQRVRIINRYDITDITDDEYIAARNVVFSEPPVDYLYEEKIELSPKERAFSVEYLPGQYDQRADSAAQCVQFLTLGEKPRCRAGKIIVLEGEVSNEDYEKIKAYYINPVDSREVSFEKPETLDVQWDYPGDVSQIDGFCSMTKEELGSLRNDLGLAMSQEDLEFCRQYFSEEEERDPTITEIRVIDTYWSDHCRHTTFQTKICNVEFEDGPFSGIMKSTYEQYLLSRKFVYDNRDKDICLMDLATITMKELRKRGKLDDLDVSDEINACSIVVNADIDGKNEDWLVMFKNETHNHPTEIEPFGGASTCLGGAIRDPLSGRSYVYQAMRITGSGDPRANVNDTLAGKLPQRKITNSAAAGYSSYGNQIGLAAGQVAELYDEGYVAKRMELGAVIAAAPKKNVVREKPVSGDSIILLGGRTGRDGCGGATGSSKEHDEQSIVTCSAEVQKGNPLIERNIQRLFRKEKVSRMIKKCNDFGAGGVSVAIGEIADGLDIDLDRVPTKYEGLDGTELAISESQERMAVVVSKNNEDEFLKYAADENLEATRVAVVTDTGRLRMKWRGKIIVDMSREFIDTSGVRQNTNVYVKLPGAECFEEPSLQQEPSPNTWMQNLQRLEIACQKGLVERFDSTAGAITVLMPFGGGYQLSPAEGMAAKLPVLVGDTKTCTLMSYGFNPKLAKCSPFHGAVYAHIEAIAKIVAMGGDYHKIRLTLQEYFEKLGENPEKWGKPFSALLGAYYVQDSLGLPSIGGKDSMSGTFKDIDVPPTLVAFAVAVSDANHVLSTEFKKIGSQVVLLKLCKDSNKLPDFVQLDKNYSRVHELAKEDKILAAHSIRSGGVAEAVSRMCFGNMIGIEIEKASCTSDLFVPDYGSLLFEVDSKYDVDELFSGLDYSIIGHTIIEPQIVFGGKGTVLSGGTVLKLSKALDSWMKPLESVFPTKVRNNEGDAQTFSYQARFNVDKEAQKNNSLHKSYAKPRVFIPVFPGTSCEYELTRAFENAGGTVDIQIVKNLTPSDIRETVQVMQQKIKNCQIIMLPGGLSAGNEPEGSAKFFTTVFRNSYIKESVMELLNNRDGLILGISNGFQALVKLGLLPYGEFRDMNTEGPTLTINSIGRHVSCIAQTRIASAKSPWLYNARVGDIHAVAISHTEGRFVATEAEIAEMVNNGQIATQYVDLEGRATYDIRYNPNGSMHAIEGITSLDGRILGKMGHSERIGTNVCRNVPGDKDQRLFESGIKYFG